MLIKNFFVDQMILLEPIFLIQQFLIFDSDLYNTIKYIINYLCRVYSFDN